MRAARHAPTCPECACSRLASPLPLTRRGCDLREPLWGFYIQPLEADHWISTARGPPSAIVDAHGQFTKTFAELQMSDAAVSEQLALPEPPFEKKTIADLVPDELRAELERARA